MYEEQLNNLVAAVILQAAEDYGYYSEKAKHPDKRISKEIAECEMRRIENFFLGQRFMLMSDLNGRELLDKLQRNPMFACEQSKKGRKTKHDKNRKHGASGC